MVLAQQLGDPCPSTLWSSESGGHAGLTEASVSTQLPMHWAAALGVGGSRGMLSGLERGLHASCGTEGIQSATLRTWLGEVEESRHVTLPVTWCPLEDGDLTWKWGLCS